MKSCRRTGSLKPIQDPRDHPANSLQGELDVHLEVAGWPEG